MILPLSLLPSVPSLVSLVFSFFFSLFFNSYHPLKTNRKKCRLVATMFLDVTTKTSENVMILSHKSMTMRAIVWWSLNEAAFPGGAQLLLDCVAQLVECRSTVPKVVGSSPIVVILFFSLSFSSFFSCLCCLSSWCPPPKYHAFWCFCFVFVRFPTK